MMEELEKKRRFLQGLVSRAERNPADWDMALETAGEIDELADKGETFLEAGDAHTALRWLWLVVDELLPHYEILEETSQVYESLEGWSEITAKVIHATNISLEERQNLQQQAHTMVDFLRGVGLDELLKPLVAALNGEEGENE